MMNLPANSLAMKPMRRNMNLDLCLNSPPSSDFGLGNSLCNLDLTLSTPSWHNCNNNICESERKKEYGGNQVQRVTIFGEVICVFEATEVQAETVISVPASPSLPSQLYSPPGISMKRSLLNFLEKRRIRIQSNKSSPYKSFARKEVSECNTLA
ncbi:hypothetical protein ACHQM5_004444 [Ranunculus cassubicifolius]